MLGLEFRTHRVNGPALFPAGPTAMENSCDPSMRGLGFRV